MNKQLLYVLLFIFLVPAFLFAEPYLAIREGLKCGSCHVNQTGGGKRTRMGTGYGAQDLPWQEFDLQAHKVPHYWSLLNDRLSIGGDFRVANNSTFPEGDTTNTFETDKSNIYVQLDLLPEHLSFYLDETVAPGGAQSREIFALLRGLPGYGWAKAGKFIQPYGLRIEDDRAFIREVTGFNFNTPDIGAEVGFEPGNWSFVAAISNGTAGALDDNTGKQIVGSAAYVHDRFRIGASGAFNPGPTGDRTVAGTWAGLKLGAAALLGEVDFVRDEFDVTGDAREQIVTYSELNYRIVQGWNIKVGYEFYDPDRDVAENERDRVLIGVEPFLAPFVQLQIFYRFNQSIPQNDLQNADELSLRLHIYF